MTLTTSILKGTDNNYETTSEMANGLGTDFGSEGVVGTITNTSGVAPMTGAFAVNEAGTPDMTVDVTAGTAYVTATPTGQGSQLLRVVSSATESVTINANSTGGTRYDWIYLQIDATNAAAPNSTGSNVASLVTQRSTTLATDSNGTPSNSYAIAVVTVANGASSISNASITDKRANSGMETADGTVTDDKLDYPRFWQEIGRTTLSSSGDTIEVASFPARAHLKIVLKFYGTGGSVGAHIRFNSDAGSNYADAFTANGAAATQNSSSSNIIVTGATTVGESFYTAEITNESAEYKLLTGRRVQSDGTGAADSISIFTNAGLWANNSSQITTITVTNTGAGSFDAGSELIVLGHD